LASRPSPRGGRVEVVAAVSVFFSSWMAAAWSPEIT